MEVRGNGSIEQVDKSVSRYKCRKWRLWVQTEDGRKSRSFAGGVRDAKSALDAFIAELESSNPSCGSFHEYAIRWHGYRKVSGDYSPNTLRKNMTQIEQVRPYIGDMPIEKVGTAQLKKMMADIKQDRGLSGTTMRSLRQTVHAILEQAKNDGLIDSNPCDKIQQPKNDTKEVEPFSSSELTAMLDKMDGMPLDGHVMAMYLMIMLGMRSQEALALRWDDVRDGRIYVRNALKAADKSVSGTKSAAGTRTLPMPSRLSAKMDEWRYYSRDALYLSSEYVCCNRVENVMHSENLRRWAKVHGMPTQFHRLRHSNLTIMARKMPSVFDLMRYAGWSDISCTRIYVHEDISAIEDAVAKLDL